VERGIERVIGNEADEEKEEHPDECHTEHLLFQFNG
jgi:hypothetical protein